MSSGGFRSCVCIPRAELAARRDVEHSTNPAIAYEPLLHKAYGNRCRSCGYMPEQKYSISTTFRPLFILKIVVLCRKKED
jgi:hypothetical protein